MPKAIVDPYGRQVSRHAESLRSADRIAYDYPNGLDLKPGSDMHEKLVTQIMHRAREARSAIIAKQDTWERNDMTLSTYMRMDESERKVRDGDDRKPVAVVIPMSYAIRETLLTYLMAAFLDDPVWRYEGSGPEDTVGAMLLEMHIAKQCKWDKIGLALHGLWMDAISYGFGAVGINWVVQKREITVSKKVETGFLSQLFGAIGFGGNDEFTREKQMRVITEGNSLINIDPYMYLPDPEVPIQYVQKGEFAGFIDRSNRMTILSEEHDQDLWFNAEYLRILEDGRSQLFDEQITGRYDKYGPDHKRSMGTVTYPVDKINLYWRLIPAEWGLGRSEYPETWFFTLAGDQVILAAEKTDFDHGMIPIAVTAPDSDGHTTMPTSKLESVSGLQEFVDWLLKSFMHNNRKAMNDMFVVDPQLIYMKDMRDPKPGKLIRLRPGAWGKGVKDAVQQLGVVDVTSKHLGEITGIIDMARGMVGATDVMHGLRRKTSERVTATEHTDVKGGALSRLQRLAKLISLQAHEDIALMYAYNTRQYLTEETYVRAIGDWETRIMEEYGIDNKDGRYPIRPEDLDIMMDVIAHDGTIPGTGDAQSWLQLYQIMAGNPEIAAQHDMGRVFKHIARIMGAKNLKEFEKKGGGNRLQLQVQPDEQALNNVADQGLSAIR